MTANTTSLIDITRHYHASIDEVFLLHQEALLEQQFPLAKQLLHWFTELLDQHIELEDGLLFPAHQGLSEEVRWQTSLYSHEHQKLRQLLLELTLRFNALHAAPSRRGLLALLDYQRTFKNVLEHHEEREEIALLVELDLQLEHTQRQRLLQQISQQWPDLDSLRLQCRDFLQQLS